MPQTHLKKGSMVITVLGLFVGIGLTATIVTRYTNRAETSSTKLTDAKRISNLLSEMETVNLESLPALDVTPYALPPAGVDVMRVRLEESYDVSGVGKDTVELSGWIAVKHFNTRPVEGQQEVKWGTAITDTEFVGMDLHGDSKLFGPVHVRLNQDKRTIGHVGKIELPFPIGSVVDVAYRQQTGVYSNGTQAAVTPQRVRPKRGDAGAVEQVIRGVLDGVSNKDPKTMLRYYDLSAGNLFFGMTVDGPKKNNAEDHIKAMSTQFENIRSIKATPNDDIDIQVSGPLATAALTGVNNVVDNEGRKFEGHWRWSVVLRKKGDGWKINHDHIDFYIDANAPAEMRELQAQCSATARGAATKAAASACNCVASISVDVDMPKMNLHMATLHPVVWYSQVDTIPPVGFVASVLLTPTPMIEDGREVATMIHGAVKFREVVRFLPLEDPSEDHASGN